MRNPKSDHSIITYIFMDKTIYLCLAHMSEEGIEQKYVKEAFETNWVVPLVPNVYAFDEYLYRVVVEG